MGPDGGDERPPWSEPSQFTNAFAKTWVVTNFISFYRIGIVGNSIESYPFTSYLLRQFRIVSSTFLKLNLTVEQVVEATLQRKR